MVEEADTQTSMSALAILSCRQNSHTFQERHISLHEPAKIGRSVARARPAPNNGIFDCKVLSRNHAMLWYENGVFYLQDTKSSNGTFVNDQRLCKGGEESAPQECFSGDLIQFGVKVMENNRRGESITHGCIVATITLYHPDGREAKPALYNTPTPGITIQSQELYKLAQYLQEALHREKMLEQKLSTLQDLVQNTQESSEGGWQALIDEDRLLSRLEVLENQLHAYSKNHTEDTLRQELVTLQEEKLNYEQTAKESLMKVLQEKIEAVTKLSDLERSLTNSEDECGHLKDMCQKTQDELQLLAEKYQDQLKEVQDIQIELQDAESKHQTETEQVEKEKVDLSEKIDNMIKQEEILTAKLESLQADNDIAGQQVTTMKIRMEKLREANEDDQENNMKMSESDQEKLIDSENEVIIPPSVDKDQLPEDVEGKLRETQLQIEVYKAKLEDSEMHLKETSEKVEQLQSDLELALLDSRQYIAKITALEVQLTESSRQSDSSHDLIQDLQNQIVELERELSIYKVPQPERTVDTTIVQQSPPDEDDDFIDSGTLRFDRQKQKEDAELEKLLKEAKDLQKLAEDELSKCQVDLDESVLLVKKTGEENSALKTELSHAQTQVLEKSEMVIDLQDQLQKAELTTQEVKQQILHLRDQLLEEQEMSKHNLEEMSKLTNDVDNERTSHKDTRKNLDEAKKLLSEAQLAAKQSHNEAEQLRTNEFTALKEECASLRKRIQAIEAEMKMSRRENLQLSSEYNKLEESYKQLEALKEKLEVKETAWMSNLTDSQKETEHTFQELQDAKEEIVVLKKTCDECTHEVTRLKGDLKRQSGDYSRIATRSKVISFCSCIPLLMLLFAILISLYPTLEHLTATAT